jgi:hypothetical protein
MATPHQKKEPGHEGRGDGEVEDVGDRGERQLPAEELDVVVGDHVAGHEQGLAEGEQVPPPRRGTGAGTCNSAPHVKESLGQVLWALGFAGLGVLGDALVFRLQR